MAKDRSRTTVKPKAAKQRTYKLEERQTYFDLRSAGLGKMAAASEAGVTPKTAKKWEDAWEDAGNPSFDNPNTKAPKKDLSLSPDARRSRKEFNYFIERYFGRVALPWQEDVSQGLALLSTSPEKEFAVVNLAPGSGKSTLITHDFLAWMIAYNRGIRICILSVPRTMRKSSPIASVAASRRLRPLRRRRRNCDLASPRTQPQPSLKTLAGSSQKKLRRGPRRSSSLTGHPLMKPTRTQPSRPTALTKLSLVGATTLSSAMTSG
jgi:hypothetical protein